MVWIEIMRICPFCTSVEDETHFLTKCKIFRHMRAGLLLRVGEILNMQHLTNMEGKTLLGLLLGHESLARLVAKYLTRSMELRDFLIESYRQSM